MNILRSVGASVPWLLVVTLVPTVVRAAGACDNVSSIGLPHTTITSTEVIAAGAFKPANAGRAQDATTFKKLPAFCRVAATLKPASDSEIRIEVWMPQSGWNGKLQSVGNGAWAGVIGYPALATALSAGYATASTDTGHQGNSADFIPGHPEKLIDFAYRSAHEMTVAAKAIVAAYYNGAPKFSYWNGCSTGGRQAMVELQRYPADYDGVIAGDQSATPLTFKPRNFGCGRSFIKTMRIISRRRNTLSSIMPFWKPAMRWMESRMAFWRIRRAVISIRRCWRAKTAMLLLFDPHTG